MQAVRRSSRRRFWGNSAERQTRGHTRTAAHDSLLTWFDKVGWSSGRSLRVQVLLRQVTNPATITYCDLRLKRALEA